MKEKEQGEGARGGSGTSGPADEPAIQGDPKARVTRTKVYIRVGNAADGGFEIEANIRAGSPIIDDLYHIAERITLSVKHDVKTRGRQ